MDKLAMTVLEICVDSVESAIAAETGGAQQVELCSALLEGGLTPSLGLIRAVRARISIGLHVMIRPRSGDFVYSEAELDVMREDIKIAAEAGADGVVFGLLNSENDVDVERTRELVGLARPLEVTFHRAIDVTRNLSNAVESIVLTGADRILTSGGEPTATEGRHTIRQLVDVSAGRIRIMAGGNVRPQNLPEIAKTSGVVEYHAALRHPTRQVHPQRAQSVYLGEPSVGYGRSVVRTADVQRLRQTLDSVLISGGSLPGTQADAD